MRRTRSSSVTWLLGLGATRPHRRRRRVRRGPPPPAECRMSGNPSQQWRRGGAPPGCRQCRTRTTCGGRGRRARRSGASAEGSDRGRRPADRDRPARPDRGERGLAPSAPPVDGERAVAAPDRGQARATTRRTPRPPARRRHRQDQSPASHLRQGCSSLPTRSWMRSLSLNSCRPVPTKQCGERQHNAGDQRGRAHAEDGRGDDTRGDTQDAKVRRAACDVRRPRDPHRARTSTSAATDGTPSTVVPLR